MSINPTALVVWLVAASVGYLINGLEGALMGFAIMASISILLAFIVD